MYPTIGNDFSALQRIDPRVERAKSDIAARLRAVCADMSEEEFEELMEQMAEVQIKYTPPAQSGLDAAPQGV